MLWVCVATSGTRSIVRVERKMHLTKYQGNLEVNVTLSVEKLKIKGGWLL